MEILHPYPRREKINLAAMILKPKNVVVWYEAVLDFLARHMA